ncbi:MAG: GlsB/YeaQ/YmgE family stress response membrane protein [Anaerolineae bacterium]|nr:GlsB/YeaQ/YmgE family stress response membrane protein [Anaerolineae bacterium]
MDIVNIISWIIFGGLAGWVASIIMKQNASMGLVANVVVGIVGAFVGGWLYGLIGGSAEGFNITSFIVAVVGAIVLLAIIGFIAKRRAA